MAVEQFYKLFPELVHNKLYITGESYAGVYVPTLAEEIIKREQDGTYTGAPLAGIGVGNGCSGNEVGICGWGTQGTYYEWLYLLSSSLVERSVKNLANSVCNWYDSLGLLPFVVWLLTLALVIILKLPFCGFL
jgi:carboxypeptidase C (cathepsin A)